MQIAAILHDTLEDTDATEADIKEFGDDVLEAVKLVTRAKGADETEYVKNILKNNMAATVKNADRIAVVNGGRITEQGTHDELIALNGEYAQLYKLQLRQ